MNGFGIYGEAAHDGDIPAHTLVQMADYIDFDIDRSEAVLRNDPEKIYAEYDHLRKSCPVVHTSQYNGYWLLTR
jgi:hypothetical protein